MKKITYWLNGLDFNAFFTPTSVLDVSTLVGSIQSISALVLQQSRTAPLGYLCILDSGAPAIGSSFPGMIPVVDLFQPFPYLAWGGANYPFGPALFPRGAFLGWSLSPYVWDPLLAKIPAATLGLSIGYTTFADDDEPAYAAASDTFKPGTMFDVLTLTQNAPASGFAAEVSRVSFTATSSTGAPQLVTLSAIRRTTPNVGGEIIPIPTFFENTTAPANRWSASYYLNPPDTLGDGILRRTQQIMIPETSVGMPVELSWELDPPMILRSRPDVEFLAINVNKTDFGGGMLTAGVEWKEVLDTS